MSLVIESLIAGNQAFRKKYFESSSDLFRQLTQHGQKPKTLQLHAWYFDLTTGFINAYDEHKKSWAVL